MKIILVRHLESIKNLHSQFASDTNLEGLTDAGKKDGEFLAHHINEYIKCNTLKIKKIYCADSSRAIETANIIAVKTETTVEAHDDLNSIRHNAFSGLPEDEIEKISPEFIYQLKLYRLGLFNSYQIIHNEQNEKVTDFEKRVIKTLVSIIENQEQENIKIIILHRSSILATLFYFVRTYYNYPKDFYGYVQIDVGHICLLEITDNSLIIKAVNQPASFLNQ